MEYKAYGMHTLDEIIENLEVADNDGDVAECLSALKEFRRRLFLLLEPPEALPNSDGFEVQR